MPIVYAALVYNTRSISKPAKPNIKKQKLFSVHIWESSLSEMDDVLIMNYRSSSQKMMWTAGSSKMAIEFNKYLKF